MKKYLITSQEFYSDKEEIFTQRVKEQFKKHSPDYALFRDKSTHNYEKLAQTFIEACKETKTVKSFLHQDSELAHRLKADGVHLTSTQFDKIKDAKGLGLEVIISTHTYEEVLKAEELGADAVTYSPIFATPNKGEPKGVDDLKELLNKCKIKVFALGGIVEQKQVEAIKDTLSYGFASIRFFY